MTRVIDSRDEFEGFYFDVCDLKLAIYRIGNYIVVIKVLSPVKTIEYFGHGDNAHFSTQNTKVNKSVIRKSSRKCHGISGCPRKLLSTLI
jgi:hypothetical protein